MARFEPLSTSRIANTKPSDRDIWLADSDGRRGFGRLVLRISPNGARHFYFKYSEGGVRRVIPLGPYAKDSRANHLTLGQARNAAQKALESLRSQATTARLSASNDVRTPAPLPQHTRDATNRPLANLHPLVPPGASQATLDELCAEYVKHMRKAGKISADETGARFARHLTGTPLGLTVACNVSAKEIAAHLRTLVTAGKGRTAGLLRAGLSAAYELALGSETDASVSGDWFRFQIASNPVRNVASLSKYSKARTRRLTNAELAYLWPLLRSSIESQSNLQFSDRFIRLTLLLGGQRCEQLARATTQDVDLNEGLLTLKDPKGRRVVARIHRIPISSYALPDLRWFMDVARDMKSNHLFPGKEGESSTVTLDTISSRVKQLSKKLQRQVAQVRNWLAKAWAPQLATSQESMRSH